MSHIALSLVQRGYILSGQRWSGWWLFTPPFSQHNTELLGSRPVKAWTQPVVAAFSPAAAAAPPISPTGGVGGTAAMASPLLSRGVHVSLCVCVERKREVCVCVVCLFVCWLVGWPQMRADVQCICMHACDQVLQCHCHSSESLSCSSQERMVLCSAQCFHVVDATAGVRKEGGSLSCP